ncbi:MAG: hypothetical protein ABL994_04640, partial [Verrucomicrobiales bacterium]
MSKVSRRVRKKRSETGALQILEEAFHLVRSLEVRHFWTFYLGAVPFALGFLYFTADMSRSSLAERDAAFAALVMVALYFWMRYCQAKFCAGLWDALNPGNERRSGRSGQFGSLAALWFLHAFHVPLLVVGFFFVIPLGWILAAQQNFTVLALTRDHEGRPFRSILGKSVHYSHYEWAQNHGLLIILFFVSLFTWVNIIATCVLVPGFGKSLFGIESIFSLSPAAAIMNTTFLLGSFLLLQMVIAPLMHAAYVLRCFYAESRLTGADLLSRLAASREKRQLDLSKERGHFAKSVLIVILVTGLGVEGALTQEITQEGKGAENERVEQFRQSIAETLEQKQYQWQFSRRVVEADAGEEETWIGRRMGEIAESARKILAAVEDWIEKAIKKMMERGRQDSNLDNEQSFKFFKELSSTASLVMVVVILGLLIWLAAVLYRKHRTDEKITDADEGISGVIDLTSEDIVASQLQEEEWLKLAREQIERGEERLAVRALFLATLAHLGEKGLLKIARFKSNRDYRGELGIRARSLNTLRLAFDENTNLFERIWYGLHSIG